MRHREAANSRQAASLYRHAPLLTRLLARGRPYICPFGPLLDEVPAGASIFDIGCGVGLFLGLLANQKRIGTGVGIDANEKAIAQARAMAATIAGGPQLG